MGEKSNPSSESWEETKPKLHVRVEPMHPRPNRTTNPSINSIVYVNDDINPVLIHNEHFTGHLVFRVRNFDGWTPLEETELNPDDDHSKHAMGTERKLRSLPPISDCPHYFEGHKRTFSLQVSGRFRRQWTGDEVMFGTFFKKKINLPRGSGLALAFAQRIDPSMEYELYSETPFVCSPILCAMNTIHIQSLLSTSRSDHYITPESQFRSRRLTNGSTSSPMVGAGRRRTADKKSSKVRSKTYRSKKSPKNNFNSVTQHSQRNINSPPDPSGLHITSPPSTTTSASSSCSSHVKSSTNLNISSTEDNQTTGIDVTRIKKTKYSDESSEMMEDTIKEGALMANERVSPEEALGTLGSSIESQGSQRHLKNNKLRSSLYGLDGGDPLNDKINTRKSANDPLPLPKWRYGGKHDILEENLMTRWPSWTFAANPQPLDTMGRSDSSLYGADSLVVGSVPGGSTNANGQSPITDAALAKAIKQNRTSSSHRRQWFLDSRNRRRFIFHPDTVYSFDFASPYVDMNQLVLKLGISISVPKYLGDQPVRYECRSRDGSTLFWAIELSLA